MRKTRPTKLHPARIPSRAAVLATTLTLATGIAAAQMAGTSIGGATSMSAGLPDGENSLLVRTTLEPGPPAFKNATNFVTRTSPGSIVHMILDRDQKTYFGYQVNVETLDPNRFRLTFAKLTGVAELSRMKQDLTGWTSLELPSYPEAQVLERGDVLAFDLLQNRATGQRIVEYLKVDYQGRRFTDETSPAEARDFTVADAELRLDHLLRVRIDGEPIEGGSSGGTTVGAVLVAYLPGHGRFLMTLAPHPELGYVDAGEVRGSTITFSSLGHSFVLETRSTVAPGPYPAYKLYVRQEPGYAPSGDARFKPFFGSQDMASGGLYIK